MDRPNSAGKSQYTSGTYAARQSGAGYPKEPIRSKLNYNPIDISSAKFIAKELFGTYDENRSGAIEGKEAKSMIIDAYTNINKLYIPKDQDVQQYIDIHDNDRDGRLTLADLEQVCMKYLCGPTLSGGVSIIDDPTCYSTEKLTPVKHETSTSKYTSSHYRTPASPGMTASGISNSQSGLTARDKLKHELVSWHGYNSERIETDLRHARSIFEKYDINKDGSLDGSEIRLIIQDTYNMLNLKLNPTDADIQKYIEMMDKNSDGKISLYEYEIFVLNALKKRHIEI